MALALLIYGVVFLLAFLLLYLAVKRGVVGGMREAAGKGKDQAGGARRILDERYAPARSARRSTSGCAGT